MADRQFEYMLLDRLKGDCDYFLGVCAEAAARGDGTIAGAERQLWAGSVESQITKMRELFDMRLTDEAVASPIVTLCTCSYNRWADNERTVVYAAPIGAEKSASENPQVDGAL